MFYSNGGERIDGFGVRPLVSIKSTVTVEQLEKITGMEDPTWPGHAGQPDS